MKGKSFIKVSSVYLIFTVSGASALVYQALWARWLGLVMGNTTLSVSIVLGSFMAGLALGSWLAGRFLKDIQNPLLSYAYVEFGIGIFALCFPMLAKLAESVFVAAVSSESSTVLGIAVRVLLSGGLLLIPTTLMGATLPFLADFFHRSPSYTKNWRVGLLYAANTLGAAIGIFVSSFILIELIGIRATTFVAAGLNFFVAAVGYRLSRSLEVERKEVAAVQERRLSGAGRFAIMVVTASGALALASEVLWTRTLETLIGNSTYAFASIVLLYLLGIAAGSWIISLFVNRLKNLPLWIVTAQLLMGIWVLVSVRLFQGIVDSIAKYGGIMVQLSTIFAHYLEVMIVLLPLSWLSGACFPLATRIVDHQDEDAKGALVARVYAWNTVGALVGSLAAGFVIAPLWDYFNSLSVLAALYCLTAAAAFAFIANSSRQVSPRRPASFILGALSVVLAIYSFIGAGDKDYYQRRFESQNPEYKVVFHKPGIQGVTTAIKMPLPGTMSGVDDLETLSRMIRTFAQVFPYTYFRKSLHNIGLHVIGSMEPIVISPDIIMSKLANGKVLDDINEWDKVSPEYFSTGWIPFPPSDLMGPVITDNEPFLEFYLLRTIRSGGQKTHPFSYW